MLKLMRNLLADYEEITYIENGQLYRACWKYIVELNNVQENTGFKLGTKLKKKHIAWTKDKMNVSMAAQTLSSSVTDGIEFLSFGMQMNEFDGSYGTVKFIRKIDMAFDMLNSRNPCDTGAKKTSNKQQPGYMAEGGIITGQISSLNSKILVEDFYVTAHVKQQYGDLPPACVQWQN